MLCFTSRLDVISNWFHFQLIFSTLNSEEKWYYNPSELCYRSWRAWAFTGRRSFCMRGIWMTCTTLLRGLAWSRPASSIDSLSSLCSVDWNVYFIFLVFINLLLVAFWHLKNCLDWQAWTLIYFKILPWSDMQLDHLGLFG